MRVCASGVERGEGYVVSGGNIYLGSYRGCVYRIVCILPCPCADYTTEEKVVISGFTKGMIACRCSGDLIKDSRPVVIGCCRTVSVRLIELRPRSVWRLYRVAKRLIDDEGNQNITDRTGRLRDGLGSYSSISCKCTSGNKSYCHITFSVVYGRGEPSFTGGMIRAGFCGFSFAFSNSYCRSKRSPSIINS